MKVLTILGTRPEIIRLSRVIEKLDGLCDHRLVHTGQNFDPNLSDVFFSQLGVRTPDHYMGVKGASFGDQIGQIIIESEKIMQVEKPDRILILGDTNSALSAIVAKRMGIPVFHMEAGNRCYDDRVPEEVNRRIIDHSSDILMPYTERSRQNLLREGIAGERIYVTGNPINEVIRHYDEQICASKIVSELELAKDNYFLVTMHRAENVDYPVRLQQLTTALENIHDHYKVPVIVSTHPRTRNRMKDMGLSAGERDVRFLDPFGFFDFITLERNALCVISDSGTVQEECAIFNVPNVTIRDVTERPETIECGSNMLSGADADMVMQCVRTVLSQKQPWHPPQEYTEENVSSKVIKIVLGFHLPRQPRID
jgi:UDP-N-acetylglucosamine 2-epimerase (non-hydrolysing)